jgi:DNA-binding CsgD family transcriptional regulator
MRVVVASSRAPAGGTVRNRMALPLDEESPQTESVSRFMFGLSETINVDGLLVACHHDDAFPIVLFENGECHADRELQQSLLVSAARSLEELPSQPGHVSAASNHPAGLAFTASLLLRELAITVTGFVKGGAPGAANACRQRLAGLLPIIWPFFTLWAQRKDVAHRLSKMEAALEMSGSRTFLLDRAGRLLFANSSGREFLAAGRGLGEDGGRLTASSLGETLRLGAAIEYLYSADRCDKSTTPVLAIKRRNMRPLMITLSIADSDGGDDRDKVIVARLFDPETDPSELIAPACRYYQLSPSESRLALLITEGRSLAAAAKEMSVREHTARSYLKQIFLKTETNRQAELVALMLRSGVQLAPRRRTQVF